MLAGKKGHGKSTLSFSLAATISNGGKFPDATVASEGKVLIWSGEDGADDTIVPRLIAMGGKLENIFILSAVREGNGEERAFDPSTDLRLLEKTVEKIEGGIDLLILDPFVSAVTKGKNSHNNAETRQGLQHVVDFAERHNCAILGVHHVTKGTNGQEPVERVTGSLAFAAIPRIVLMTAVKNEDGNKQRLLARAASNIGPDGGAFGYEIAFTTLQEPPIESSYIKWGDYIPGEARDLISDAEDTKDDDKLSALEEACEFLKQLLRDGPRPAKEVFECAEKEGHKIGTIQRAKTRLRIKPEKEIGCWVWKLPSASDGIPY